jgi:3-oxoacyl-[acyl-carrier protein] reductase
MELIDKIAIVTGGSRGIGKGIVLGLINEGAKVTFCYESNENAAKAVLNEIESMNGTGYSKKVDITDRSAAHSFIKETYDRFGKIDILVNNAGIQRHGRFIEHSFEDWDRVIKVNLYGQFILSRIVSKIMIKQRYGKIINISSRMYMGAENVVSYSASKAGIIGLTKSMAMELGPFNINVNCIAPGAVDTEMAANMPDGFREERIAITPLRRFGNPEEIGYAVAFLASEKAAFITGEVLHVTGGVYG